jgi:hypothetical protein
MCNNECKCKQTEPKKRIPFNLERALAGDPVVIRGGKEVTELTLFKGLATNYPLNGVINGALKNWTVEGKWLISEPDHSHDLYMKPRPSKKLWIAVSKTPVFNNCSTYNLSGYAEENASELNHKDRNNYHIIQIELPED